MIIRLALPAAVALCGAMLIAPDLHAQSGQPSAVTIEGRLTQQDLLRLLTTRRVSVSSGAVSARDALRHLDVISGIPIVGRYRDDRVGHGIDPATEIDLQVTDAVVLDILTAILDTCSDEIDQCTWQLRDGYVEVGTKARLASPSAMVTRVYPIKDLLIEPKHFDNAPVIDLDAALGQATSAGGGGAGGGGEGGGAGSGTGGGSIFTPPGDDPESEDVQTRIERLAELIRTVVEPEAWRAGGGDWAVLSVHADSLIVRGPDFVHRGVAGYVGGAN